jgi:hypothetical protein
MMNSNPVADNPRPSSAIGPERILGGLDYLEQCLRENQPCAVITGSDPAGINILLHRFTWEKDDGHVACIAAPSHDCHKFLQSILTQFGFETFDSSVAELQKLISVYVRHEATNGRRIIITVEGCDEFGPTVLNSIQYLASLDNEEGSAILFVLAGSPALHRVLDSPGMLAVSAMADQRFDLDTGQVNIPDPLPPPSAEDEEPGPAELLVSLDGNLVRRYPLTSEQLLIGRNEHNDIAIVSRYVSRHHALLVNHSDGAYIVDLKSTNGTFINSLSISQHALKDGDVISIGNFRLKYLNAALPRAAGMPDASAASFSETVVMRSARGIDWHKSSSATDPDKTRIDRSAG